MKPLDPTARPSASGFDVHLTENVMVPMRDGVRMATDIYRPARDGRPLADRRPVLLHRTPYNKTETEATSGQCRWFAARGYVVVNQDCRGCFGSEGDVNFLIPEAEDGADTIAWIRKQEWCDGTVGAFGTSWSGWTQTAMAALGPEGLATLVPNMSGADGHESSVRHGGALELRFLAWAFWHSAYNTQAALTAPPHVTPGLNLGAPRFSDWLERMPIRVGQTQLALVPPYEKWALELLTRADYDDYWKHPSVNPRAHWDRFPDMPILLVGDWSDFTAKLIDVYPPSLWYPQGYALNLTDSIARLRYRNGRERGEAATPGVPVQVTTRGRRSGGSGGGWWRTIPCSTSEGGSRGWCCRSFRASAHDQ